MVYQGLRTIGPLARRLPLGGNSDAFIPAERMARFIPVAKAADTPPAVSERFASDDLACAIASAIDDERQRIASDIHDDIGHRLTVALYQLDHALGNSDGLDSQRTEMAILRRMLADCLDALRTIPWKISTGLTEEPNLGEAIELMLSEIPETEFLHVDLVQTGPIDAVPARLARAAIRIAQEAVTNVLKYAKASSIRVRLSTIEGEFILDVEDNGIGFNEGDRGSQGGGHGLIGMRQRAVAAGGSLYIHSHPDTGTRVRFVAPFVQGS